VTNKESRAVSKRDTFITGGIFAVLGLYVMLSSYDTLGGFVLLGIGIVMMASISKEFRTKLFEFFLSIFRGLWEILSSKRG
jgi:hypothetical protein